MAVGFAVGLGGIRTSATRSYFNKFNVLPPGNVPITSMTEPSGAESFATLVQAIVSSSSNSFLVVTHGYENGSGLYLRFFPGTERVTKTYLRRFTRMAEQGQYSQDDLDTLRMNPRQARRLTRLMTAARAKNIELIEFRGCNLGRDPECMREFARFFRAQRFGAPDLHSFFGLVPVATGLPILGNHSGSHSGQTFSYSFRFPTGRGVNCIGIDQERKPANGHLIGETAESVNSWIGANLQARAQHTGGDLPMHGLWEFPNATLNLDSAIDDLFAPEQQPRPIWPLAPNREYGRHIIYVTASHASLRREPLTGGQTAQYAANHTGPVRGAAARFDGTTRGGTHRRGPLSSEETV